MSVTSPAEDYEIAQMYVELDRLRSENEGLRHVQRTLWMVVASNGGYTLERSDIEDYPGDDRAILTIEAHPEDRTVTLSAESRRHSSTMSQK